MSGIRKMAEELKGTRWEKILFRPAGEELLDGYHPEGSKGGSVMENEQELTEFELARDLKPISQMSPGEIARERARVNQDQTHPFWTDGPHHQAAVERMIKLSEAGPRPKSDLEKGLEKAGITSKEGLDEEADRLWEKYEQEQLQAKFEKAQDQLAARLVAEGKPVKKEDAGLVLSDGAEFVQELKKQGLVDDGFFEYLDESGKGNDLDTIRSFALFKKLTTNYEAWKKDKAKGGGR